MKTRVLMYLTLLASCPALAGMPFPQVPDWESADVGSVSTGAALVDLDHDGWLDLVVSNGNDMRRQPVVVYYNRGDGTFPDSPDWSSQSEEYHGMLSVGDVDQDGWEDVAVGIYIGPAGFSEPGWAALYLNDGSGGLPPTPSWVSADRHYGFNVALGDGDGDGDLDLAVAVGEPYSNPPDRSRVYWNLGGALETSAGWLSDEVEHNTGVGWGDADNDGDLDLVLAGTEAPHRVYYQSAGGLETASGWESASPSPFGLRLSVGDFDRDGLNDLAVAENNQLSGGTGRFRLFPGTATGFQIVVSWSSNRTGYGSEALMGDANGDGWPDLLCGSWGADRVYSDVIRIYANRYGRGPDGDPQTTVGTGSVIETIVLGDVDNDGLRRGREAFAGDGTRKVFYLKRLPFRRLLRVVADGLELGPADMTSDPARGWLALATAPSSELEVEYEYSERLDMAVSNWDNAVGNFLFYARPPAVLRAVRGATGTELKLTWTDGTAPFDVLEAREPEFGPGLALRAEAVAASEWSDAPGTLSSGGLTFYRVY